MSPQEGACWYGALVLVMVPSTLHTRVCMLAAGLGSWLQDAGRYTSMWCDFDWCMGYSTRLSCANERQVPRVS